MLVVYVRTETCHSQEVNFDVADIECLGKSDYNFVIFGKLVQVAKIMVLKTHTNEFRYKIPYTVTINSDIKFRIL